MSAAGADERGTSRREAEGSDSLASAAPPGESLPPDVRAMVESLPGFIIKTVDFLNNPA